MVVTKLSFYSWNLSIFSAFGNIFISIDFLWICVGKRVCSFLFTTSIPVKKKKKKGKSNGAAARGQWEEMCLPRWRSLLKVRRNERQEEHSHHCIGSVLQIAVFCYSEHHCYPWLERLFYSTVKKTKPFSMLCRSVLWFLWREFIGFNAIHSKECHDTPSVSRDPVTKISFQLDKSPAFNIFQCHR